MYVISYRRMWYSSRGSLVLDRYPRPFPGSPPPPPARPLLVHEEPALARRGKTDNSGNLDPVSRFARVKVPSGIAYQVFTVGNIVGCAHVTTLAEKVLCGSE